MFDCLAANSGTTTLTAGVPTNTGEIGIAYYEVSNSSRLAWNFDKGTANASGLTLSSSPNATSGAIQTIKPTEFLVGFVDPATSSATSGEPSWVYALDQTGNSSEYFVTSSLGSYSATFNFSAAGEPYTAVIGGWYP